MNNYKYRKNTYPIGNSTITSHTYDSWESWNKLLVIWAIHWNEICWPQAINLIIKDINENILSLVSGSVTFIPVSNPEAFKQNIRIINKDLWRNFILENLWNSYEDQIIQIISTYVDNSDYLLDIHSTQAKSKPCVFQDWETEKNSAFALSLWINDIITWWPNIYIENDSPDVNMYAHTKDKTWVLVECGSHLDIAAKHVWYNAIQNSLLHTNITQDNNTTVKNDVNNNVINIEKLYTKDKKWVFTKKWKHLEKITQWEAILEYLDWEIIYAEKDCYILFPKDNANIWDEWYYLWY